MKRSMVTLLSGISIAALLVGGCANKEAVKKEEAVVPVAAVENVQPAAKPVEQPKPVEAVSTPVVAPVQVAPTPKVETNPEVAPQPVELKFETVYFDFDKADLRQDARDVLSKNAEIILKAMANTKVQIEGHCDERGSAEYNLALGEKRAKSALNYLTTLGVKADRLSVISYGKEKPAVIGNDESAWAKNRRAEFVIVK
ncbi:MAG: peptidoglycan-associated lipoprotein Pal [Desulfuromonadaceae bacterium]|nr:peptidoglycan-associated lipoprotein Pal [Desulfuromonadaceae bacterium]